MIRVLTIALGLLISAVPVALSANTATVNGADGLPGATVTLSVDLTTDVDVAGVQLSMTLPEGTAYAAGSAAACGRAAEMSASGGVRDRRLNLTLYTLGNSTIPSGAGRVLTFDLVLGDTPLLAPLNVEAVLAATDGEAIPTECVPATLAIRGAAITVANREYTLGRVALGEPVSVTASVTNSGTEPLIITGIDGAAEWTLNGITTIAAGTTAGVTMTYVPAVRGTHDAVIRMTSNAGGADAPIIVHADGYGRNEVSMTATAVTGVEESTVSVNLKNYDPIYGFTLRLKLPRNFTYVPGSCAIAGSRGDGHAITAATTTDNDGVTTLTLTSYSFANNAFKGNDGEVATFRILAASRYGAWLTLDKAVLPTLLDGAVTDVMSAKSDVSISVTSPVMNISRRNDLGRTSILQNRIGSVGLSNYGSAPLTITGYACDDDDAVVLTTPLPLTLNPWCGGSLDFERTDTKRGEMTRTVLLYSNDPEAPVLAVDLTMDRYSPNELAIRATEADEADDEVTFYVSMTNNDSAEGMQFDIEYDTALDGAVSAAVSERATGFMASVRRLDAGRARAMVYGIGREIAAGTGDVVSVTLRPDAGLREGSYHVGLANVVIGGPEMDNIHSNMETAEGYLPVATFVLGDANKDNRVTMTDVNLMINHIVQPAKSNIRPKTIDMNCDGKITMADTNLHLQTVINQ